MKANKKMVALIITGTFAAIFYLITRMSKEDAVKIISDYDYTGLQPSGYTATDFILYVHTLRGMDEKYLKARARAIKDSNSFFDFNGNHYETVNGQKIV